MSSPSRSRRRLADADYVTLAGWRAALRRFLAFSRAAAEAEGLPPQQHQTLLAIKGSPEQGPVTIGDIAAHLQLRHHSAVGLVDRLARKKLVRRIAAPADRRRVHVALTPAGEALIERLSQAHVAELRQLKPALRRLLDTL